MKAYLQGFWMCQSMFCAVPFPGNLWNEEARDKMLLFLPVVGLEMGVLWAVLGWLIRLMSLPTSIGSFLLCAYPFLITGFIHLDGFLDVMDAVKSYRSLERRREILKDSHVGAFAVIGCCLLMLGQFAACMALTDGYGCLVLLPVVSRCCSVLAVDILKPMTTSQYSGLNAPGKDIAVLLLMLLGTLLAGFLFFGRFGFALLGAAGVHLLCVRRAYRSLEGMNGDISGYAICFSEFAGILLLALL